MIHLYLTKELAEFVASHLPPDDPLRTGIAETLALQELMGGVIDDPAPLTILKDGQVFMEIYDQPEADRVYLVLTAPRALHTLMLEGGGRARKAAAFDALAEAAGIRDT